jgi:hypothetical protein
MGHENLNTTQVYLGLNDASRKDAIAKLDAKIPCHLYLSTLYQLLSGSCSFSV